MVWEREEEYIRKKAPGTLAIKYVSSLKMRWPTGPYFGRFFKELKENKRIIGNKCPKCGIVCVPPTEICSRCHVENEKEPIDQGIEGVLQTFDTIAQPFTDPMTGGPKKVPYAWGIISLDGGGSFAHFLRATDPKKLIEWRGKRVRAVFKEDRKGDFFDILYFEKIEGE